MKYAKIMHWALLYYIVLIGNNAFGEDEFRHPVWSAPFNDEIAFCKIIDSNLVIASTPNKLSAMSLTDGSIIWEMDDVNCKYSYDFSLIPGTNIALVYNEIVKDREKKYDRPIEKKRKCLVVLDYQSGMELWNSDSLGFYSCLDGFPILSQDAILVCAYDGDNSYWMAKVDLYTGKLIWENKDYFNKYKPNLFDVDDYHKTIYGNQLPMFDSDSTMITLFNKGALRKWNTLSGDLIWETPLNLKHASALTEGYPQSLYDAKAEMIFTPARKTIYAIDKNDGEILWETKIDCPRQILQMMLIEEGILVRGGARKDSETGKQYLFLLNPTNGKVIWEQKKLKLRSPLTSNFIVENGEATIYSKKRLYKISLKDGNYYEFAKKLKIKHHCGAFILSMMNDNYQLLSSQSILSVDKDGRQIFNISFKLPKGNILSGIAKFAANFVLNFALYSAVNVDINIAGGTHVFYPQIYFGSTRYLNTINSTNHLYILGQLIPPYAKTKVQQRDLKRNGIAKVNKVTGEIVEQLFLDMKDPAYDIDIAESKLVYIKKKHNIVCYDF